MAKAAEWIPRVVFRVETDKLAAVKIKPKLSLRAFAFTAADFFSIPERS